jgi:putative SOS response-associated peptidase YedK
MCGRFSQALDKQQIVDLGEVTEDHSAAPWQPRYNIAPTQKVAVVRRTAAGREMAWLHWGLVPHWARDRSGGAQLINARGETVSEKPSFQNAFRARRCLVPADGFYEWKSGDSTKQPHRITLGNGGAFAFAGLWERWERSPDGVPLETFAIVTTEANPLLQPIHHRMPVILDPADHAAWLDTALPAAEAQALLRPFPAERMAVRRVGKRVNSVAFDDPECLAEDTSPPPAPRPQQLGLF